MHNNEILSVKLVIWNDFRSIILYKNRKYKNPSSMNMHKYTTMLM